MSTYITKGQVGRQHYAVGSSHHVTGITRTAVYREGGKSRAVHSAFKSYGMPDQLFRRKEVFNRVLALNRGQNKNYHSPREIVGVNVSTQTR